LKSNVATGAGGFTTSQPQTYSMVGIILAAMRLSTPWEAK
jgi:hypothetical protein